MEEFTNQFTEILNLFSDREEINIFNAIFTDDINTIFDILENKLQREYSIEVDYLYSLLPGQTIQRDFVVNFTPQEVDAIPHLLEIGVCMN